MGPTMNDVANSLRHGVAMDRKAIAANKFSEKSPAAGRSAIRAASPEEAAELIRAFVAVKSPQVRKAILAFVENLA